MTTRTVVSFHAHPDDEVLLTGGTLAQAAADGHRVVIVVATNGEHGLTDDAATTGLGPEQPDLGRRRLAELGMAAAHLGCHRVESLGYRDSGICNEYRGFSTVDLDEAAQRLAAILIEERADVLTTYDVHGGYGHPDHVRVHEVGQRAAELARTPLVLQATIDRHLLLSAVRRLRQLRLVPASMLSDGLLTSYTERSMITHRINVRRQVRRKRRAMTAHTSQTVGGSDLRTLALLLRLPRGLFRLACGTEWYIQPDVRVPARPHSSIFATLDR